MKKIMEDKRTKTLIIAIIISLLIAIISTSYAFFTISNKTGSEETITSGTMALTFHDGAKVETDFMIPGEYIEKSFYVTNTGSLATSYDIYLTEVINDFADKTDLVYELISNDGGYSTSNQIQVPSETTKIVDSQSIGTSTTHHYTLRITFLNKNEPQDDNQGRHFSGKLQINEYQSNEVVSNLPATIDTCPDCKYTFHLADYDESNYEFYNTLTYGSSATALTSSQINNLYTDYRELMAETGKNYFLGVKVNSTTNVIEKAYSCVVEGNSPFCIEGSTDGSNFINNKNYLESLYGNACTPYENFNLYCEGDYNKYVDAEGETDISEGDNGGCYIEGSGKAYCYIWVDDSNNNNETCTLSEDTCPGPNCVFASYEVGEITYGCDAEPLTNEQISNLYYDYNNIEYEMFMGLIINSTTNKVDRAYVCTERDNALLCVEASYDGSTFTNNRSILEASYGEFVDSVGCQEQRSERDNTLYGIECRDPHPEVFRSSANVDGSIGMNRMVGAVGCNISYFGIGQCRYY